ncbi:MAG: flagellar FlbD family protein [Acidimicrobiales bacterium]
MGGQLIALNPDLIERVEATPDTVVTMIDDKKFLVEESLEETLTLITDYRAFVIARSNDLAVSETGGRPTLHVVPNDHIASTETMETYGEDLEGVDLEFEPEPDGRVHLEFGSETYDSESDVDDMMLAAEPESVDEGSSFGFGGRN